VNNYRIRNRAIAFNCSIAISIDRKSA